MLSQIYTCGLMGIEGFMVCAETDISGGMPSFDVVGLPDAAVKEAKERAKSAIKNSGFKMPSKRIITNLSPANQRKEGTSYDLPMAISLLDATEQIKIEDRDKTVFIGELSLDGSINSCAGVLPMVITAYKNGFEKAFVPMDNASEAAAVEGIDIYPVRNIREIAAHFDGSQRIEPYRVDIADYFARQAEEEPDFCDVKGQENVKRALEVAAAGNHNVIMIGSPGSGKSMLARRMGSILPDMTFDEALETTKIHSIAGILPKDVPMIVHRPMRSPHHTASSAALAGGTRNARPGELSLAHNGILFLDELPEFRRDVLEVLRQPLEDGMVTISRANAVVTYPCNIMLIASMNPCKCGYFGDSRRSCTCTEAQISKYRGKISGPLLDRIDIQVEVAAVDYDDLSSMKKGEESARIKERVNRARQLQLERYKGMKIYSNSQLTAGMIDEFCRIDSQTNIMLKAAFETLGLSARAHSRILKVARTIADLAGEKDIKAEHIAEAIQYRSLDRKYFE
ncbi:MAG: YifB family Mg chelatase-like AAA ATPase [Clostridiales bacterium]|nr:YifB family Mg chelatase-like AAA ATPase [Clostridiales bacterium]